MREVGAPNTEMSVAKEKKGKEEKRAPSDGFAGSSFSRSPETRQKMTVATRPFEIVSNVINVIRVSYRSIRQSGHARLLNATSRSRNVHYGFKNGTSRTLDFQRDCNKRRKFDEQPNALHCTYAI